MKRTAPAGRSQTYAHGARIIPSNPLNASSGSVFVVSSHCHIQELRTGLDVIDTVRRFSDEPFLVLFDSSVGSGRNDARYTILTAAPLQTCRIDRCDYGDDPLDRLRQWTQLLPEAEHAPPFCGGIAGLLSYEMGQAFERLPSPDRDEFETPAVLAGLFDWAIIWDHRERSVRLCVIDLSHVGGPSIDGRVGWVMKRLGRAISHVESIPGSQSVLSSPYSDTLNSGRNPLPSEPGVFSSFSRDNYVLAVERVIEYIRAGDIFQANIAQQLTAPWHGTPVDLYQKVRELNPAPFSGLLQAEDFAVVSASPERFLKVINGKDVETRPIKGTRRRHRSPIADLFTSNELFASEKDRAENVMIVDLLRNDLSRVCSAGSVKVTGLCEIEVFETVQHLVSTIVGELRDDCDIWDLLAATIPGGSITGAPKIRAMQIIAELEPVVRGAYCGNLFYLGPNGDFDSSILIRTFTLKNGVVQFPVGGGIVADSQPEVEYSETLHKAAGMLRCLKTGAPAETAR